MSLPGRPTSAHRSAQHEGTAMDRFGSLLTSSVLARTAGALMLVALLWLGVAWALVDVA